MARADAGRARLAALAGLLAVALAACGGGDDPQAARGIVFAGDATGDYELYRGSGGQLLNLTQSPRSAETHGRDTDPSWSPDGRRIAFISSRDHRGDGDEAGEVYVMNADGSGVRRLTEDQAPQRRPDWLPDGRVVYVECDRGYQRCRFVARDLEEDEPETLLRLPDFVFDATPSPDGKRIAYTRASRSASAKSHVWTQQLAGGPPMRIGEGGGPAWSPDGRRIAFTSARDRHGRCLFHDCTGYAPEVYVMNADGSGVRRLTRTRAYEVWPVFSPTGSELAFSRIASERDAYELWAVRTDGSAERRLTESRSGELTADWR